MPFDTPAYFLVTQSIENIKEKQCYNTENTLSWDQGFKVRRIRISEHNNVSFFFSSISMSAQAFNISGKKTLNAVLKYCTAIYIFNNSLLTRIHSHSQVPNLRICSELSKLYLYMTW